MKRIILCLFFIVQLNTILCAQCTLVTSSTFDTIVCGSSVNLSAFGTTTGTQLQNFDFNTGILPSGWTSSQILNWSNPCSPGVNGTTYLWVGADAIAPRNVSTSSFNLSTCANSGVSVCFDLLFATQLGNTPCEGPDLPNEGVFFQYSINNGSTWLDLNYFAPNGGNDPLLVNWNNWCYTLPIAALTSNTRFRWYQTQSSAASADHWGIDNFILYCNDPSYNIVWQHDGYTTGAAGGTNPVAVSPSNTTTYTAVMSNGSAACTSSVNVYVRTPVITATAGSDITICSGTCAQLSGSALVTNYPAQTQVYTNSQTVPFEGTSSSVITVNGLINPILQLNSIASVCITQLFYSGSSGFTQYDIDNISLTLTCPSGQSIILIPANTTNSGIFSVQNGFINTCFVPGGASIVGQAPPTTGNWSPNQSFNNLTGCNANGQWTLGIVTPAGATFANSGFTYGWNITFNTPEISYIPIPVWSPTTSMSNSNTYIPTVCPPPNAYTLTVSDTAGCVTVSDVVNVNTQSCATNITGIKIVGDTCDATSAIIFQVLGTSNSPYFAWNFGDPASGVNDTITITGASANPNPPHTFTAPGIYTICASFQEPGFPVSIICRTITIGQCCVGIPTNSLSNQTICSSQLPFTWNSNVYNSAGTYSDTLVNATGCDSIITLILAVDLSSCCAPNLITNGSFNSPIGFNTIASGWTGTNPGINTPDINNTVALCQAGNGFNWIGTTLPSNDGGTWQSLFGPEVIDQQVNTVIGQQYTLCFEYTSLSITNGLTTYNSGSGWL